MGETHPTPAENTSPTSAMLEGRQPIDPGNDIDARMAALLKDHKEMGARPEQEPVGDAYEATYPLTPKAGMSSLPKSMTSGAKKLKSK